MKHVIWKTELSQNINQLQLPRGADVLSCANQHGKICIWFRGDPDEEVKDTRWFAVCVTGGDCPPPQRSKFIGTILTHSGSFVCHVFEILQ